MLFSRSIIYINFGSIFDWSRSEVRWGEIESQTKLEVAVVYLNMSEILIIIFFCNNRIEFKLTMMLQQNPLQSQWWVYDYAKLCWAAILKSIQGIECIETSRIGQFWKNSKLNLSNIIASTKPRNKQRLRVDTTQNGHTHATEMFPFWIHCALLIYFAHPSPKPEKTLTCHRWPQI